MYCVRSCCHCCNPHPATRCPPNMAVHRRAHPIGRLPPFLPRLHVDKSESKTPKPVFSRSRVSVAAAATKICRVEPEAPSQCRKFGQVPSIEDHIAIVFVAINHKKLIRFTVCVPFAVNQGEISMAARRYLDRIFLAAAITFLSVIIFGAM